MVAISDIRKRMEVVDCDGKHVGIVDQVVGRQIKLSRDDPTAKGVSRYVTLDRVALVGNKVHLTVSVLVALGAITTAAKVRD